MTTTVLLLLVSGGKYEPRHVDRMVRQVRRFAYPETQVVCFSDRASDLRGIVDHTVQLSATQLSWGMEGCWPKLATTLYEGPALYLDLDVTLVRSIIPFLDEAERHHLVMSGDFWNCDPPLVNGSVNAWAGDVSYLYEEFAADPAGAKAAWPPEVLPRHWSDQMFMWQRARSLTRWQQILPDMLYSFRLEVLSRGAKNLADARIIVSHGLPRPWHVQGADAWLAAHGFEVETL